MIEICSSGSKSAEMLLNKKKPKKPAILAKISIFSENANVLRHNFCHCAAILIWKVALEYLYQQLSNAFLTKKFGPRGLKI